MDQVVQATRHLRGPEKMTAYAVCELIKEEIRERKFDNLKAFGHFANVSPNIVFEITQGNFPGKSEFATPRAQKKYTLGKIFSLTRICDSLELDLEACLIACGLPVDKHEIERSRRRRVGGKGPILEKVDFEMLIKQIELIGPIPHELIPTLVGCFRANRKEE